MWNAWIWRWCANIHIFYGIIIIFSRYSKKIHSPFECLAPNGKIVELQTKNKINIYCEKKFFCRYLFIEFEFLNWQFFILHYYCIAQWKKGNFECTKMIDFVATKAPFNFNEFLPFAGKSKCENYRIEFLYSLTTQLPSNGWSLPRAPAELFPSTLLSWYGKVFKMLS